MGKSLTPLMVMRRPQPFLHKNTTKTLCTPFLNRPSHSGASGPSCATNYTARYPAFCALGNKSKNRKPTNTNQTNAKGKRSARTLITSGVLTLLQCESVACKTMCVDIWRKFLICLFASPICWSKRKKNIAVDRCSLEINAMYNLGRSSSKKIISFCLPHSLKADISAFYMGREDCRCTKCAGQRTQLRNISARN